MSNYVNLQCHFCLSFCTVSAVCFSSPSVSSLLVMPSHSVSSCKLSCIVLSFLKLSLGFCFSQVAFTLIFATFLYRSSLLSHPLFSTYSCQISLCSNLIHSALIKINIDWKVSNFYVEKYCSLHSVYCFISFCVLLFIIM